MKRLAGATMLGLVAGLIASSVSALGAIGDITEYPVPTAASHPEYIATGADGNLWFTELDGNKIGKVMPSGAFTEYPIPTAAAGLLRITSGPDGSLWFTEGSKGKIGRITTAGAVSEFPIPYAGSYPYGIATGPDGNIWFTDGGTTAIGRMTLGGAFSEFAVPPHGAISDGVDGITAGPDGNLWFTEYQTGRIGKMTLSGALTEYILPGGHGASGGITAGPDANLWFTEGNALSGGAIGKVTTAGVFTEYPTTDGASLPWSITTGPDGNLWFTETKGNKVATITPNGVITEYAVPTAGGGPYGFGPYGITTGPDGNAWFTEYDQNKIAKVVAIPSCSAASMPATRTASSNKQYNLANSDGNTWQEIDAANLRLFCNPTANQSTLLTANADLWTANPGYNQDLGIFVSDNGGVDQLLAWKESGGFAGTFSPNAAYAQDLFNMTAGHQYTFKLKWKTNKLAAGATIFAAAGGGPIYSPTSLIAETFPTGVVPNFAVSTAQYTLPGSDGVTWQPIDAVHLSTTLAPASAATAVLGANVDLWTADAGYNQDIGIFVSDNGGLDTLIGWKESGGFAGTYSPNAAFVKATYPMIGGHTYAFTLKWKTNKLAPGTTIVAAAGGGPVYSPTTLIAESIAAGVNPYSAVSTSQYTLPNSDGASWQPIDAALNVPVTPGVDTNSIIGANADLWTATASFNQDIGIFVSDNGGADVLVAWKESGGFAGTFSPNAAFVQAAYPMSSGHAYVFKLKWKTNKSALGAAIYAAAGGGPVYSQTRLTVELTN
jgi:streptogramin lyase